MMNTCVKDVRMLDEWTRSVFESVKWTIDIAMDLSTLGRAIPTLATKVRA